MGSDWKGEGVARGRGGCSDRGGGGGRREGGGQVFKPSFLDWLVGFFKVLFLRSKIGTIQFNSILYLNPIRTASGKHSLYDRGHSTILPEKISRRKNSPPKKIPAKKNLIPPSLSCLFQIPPSFSHQFFFSALSILLNIYISYLY